MSLLPVKNYKTAAEVIEGYKASRRKRDEYRPPVEVKPTPLQIAAPIVPQPVNVAISPCKEIPIDIIRLQTLRSINVFAEKIVYKLPPHERPITVEFIGPMSVKSIASMVARHYDLTYQELMSPRRMKDIVRPRQIAMYLAKKLTSKSLPEIGRVLGDRDHTTILHGVRKIAELMDADFVFANHVYVFERLIMEFIERDKIPE